MERSPIFRNARSSRPSRKQSQGVKSAEVLRDFLARVVDLSESVSRDYPDQVRHGVIAVAAWQFVNFYGRGHDGVGKIAAQRAFERWKVRLRDLGLESAPSASIVSVDQPETGVLAPVFVMDTKKVEEAWLAAGERLKRLELALGRACHREVSAEELAAELDVSVSTIYAWVRSGLPSSSKTPGKTAARYFDLEEVKDWIRVHGSAKAKGVVARTLEIEDVVKVIRETETLTEARGRLGLSDSQFRDLRRDLGVHVPVPHSERTPAWEVVRRDEVEAALTLHEGRRAQVAEELGLSQYELREAFRHHELMDHKFVVSPESWPLSFTKEELLEAIKTHAGNRAEIAKTLGVGRETLREAIVDFDLLGHPLLQAGKLPASVSRSLEKKTAIGSGKGGKGVKTAARTRGHEHSFQRDTTLVPFWLAAIREVMARHPGRGGGRATAAELGVSPVTLTNIIQGKRIPGYEVMEQIMAAAEIPVPDWRAGLDEMIERSRSELDIARGTKLPLRAIDDVSTALEVSPTTVHGLKAGRVPSMRTLQKILEASGRPYLVEAILTPETVAYGGPAESPRVAVWRRQKAAEILKIYRSSGLSWSSAIEAVGSDQSSVLKWAKMAREGHGPFVEAVQEDPALLSLPPHLMSGATTPTRGAKYGAWGATP